MCQFEIFLRETLSFLQAFINCLSDDINVICPVKGIYTFLEVEVITFKGWCDSRKNNPGHLITTVVGVLLPPAVEVVLVPGDQV